MMAPGGKLTMREGSKDLLPAPPNPLCLQASLFYARNHRFLSCPSQTSNFTETHQCASFSFFQALGGGCKENNREHQLTTRPPGGKTLRACTYTHTHKNTGTHTVYSLSKGGKLHVMWAADEPLFKWTAASG